MAKCNAEITAEINSIYLHSEIEKKVLLSTFMNITKIMFKNIPGFAAPTCIYIFLPQVTTFLIF